MKYIKIVIISWNCTHEGDITRVRIKGVRSGDMSDPLRTKSPPTIEVEFDTHELIDFKLGDEILIPTHGGEPL